MRRQTLSAVFLGLGLVGGIAVMAQQLDVKVFGGQRKSRPLLAQVSVPSHGEPQRTPDSVIPPSVEESTPVSVPLPSPLPIPSEKLLPTESEPAPREQQLNDPMDDLKAFHQQSRQKAEDQIKALTKEAEMLGARLQKVEAALEGWKAVSTALEQDPGQKPVLSARRGFKRSEEEPPTDLSPAPLESILGEPPLPSIPPQPR